MGATKRKLECGHRVFGQPCARCAQARKLEAEAARLVQQKIDVDKAAKLNRGGQPAARPSATAEVGLMRETVVVNVFAGEECDVNIMRPSKWGNPYIIGPHGDRDRVIERYREYVMASPELMASLEELRGKRLGCCCVPLACHGDVLVELLET